MAQVSSSDFAARVRARFPGEYDKIPDDELTQRVIAKYPEYAPMVLPQGSNMPAAPQMQTSAAGKIVPAAQAVGQAGIGALKGAGQTANNIGSALIPDAAVRAVGGAVPSQQQTDSYFAPTNTAQKVGKIGEQAAEWFVPTGAEEKAGQFAAQHLPQAAKYVMPLAKMAGSAGEAGIRNMTQGGTFAGGAAGGAIGSAGGQALRAAAPTIASIAMAPGKRLLKSLPESAAPIGETVLKETTGIQPAGIANQLGEKVASTSQAQDALLQKAGNQGVTVPLAPARQTIADELGNAVQGNSKDYIRDVNKVGDQFKWQYGPDGKPVGPLASAVPPSQARDLRQGLDKTIGSWTPGSQSNIGPMQERLYGSLTGALHDAVPGSAELDQRMTNLIPAQGAARNVAFNPTITQSIFNRFGRHTGALAASLAGAGLGYKEGGTEGAVVGGLGGLAVPEVLASPEGQMAIARGLYGAPKAVMPALGAAMQPTRR